MFLNFKKKKKWKLNFTEVKEGKATNTTIFKYLKFLFFSFKRLP